MSLISPLKYRSIPFRMSLSTSSSQLPERVQILRTGTFTTPEYGTFEIKKEHLLSMKKNFDAKVRGVDISIDFAHQSALEAGAWIRQLELADEDNELWAIVDWTKMGKEKVGGKEYRYLSADFTYDYVDNETEEEFGCTLMGAGLTNRPVIKEMEPVIQLSELSGTPGQINKGDKKMSKKPADDGADDKKEDSMDVLNKQIAGLKSKLAEYEAADKSMKDMLAAYEASDKKMKADKEMADKVRSFEKLMTEGKLCAAQKEAFIAGDAQKLAELAEPVKLKTVGHRSAMEGSSTNEKDAAQQILDEAQKLLSEKKVKDLSAGVLMARKNNPELVNKLAKF